VSNRSPTFIVFFTVGFVHGYTVAAILLLSFAALLIRRRRRVLITSVSTLSWIVVATGAACGLAYVAEPLFTYFRGNPFERATYMKSVSGAYAWYFWSQAFGSVVAPQLFWFRRARTSAWLALGTSTAILVPANLEQLIVFLTAHPDFIPNSWKQ
jgi:hypothetical protein